MGKPRTTGRNKPGVACGVAVYCFHHGSSVVSIPTVPFIQVWQSENRWQRTGKVPSFIYSSIGLLVYEVQVSLLSFSSFFLPSGRCCAPLPLQKPLFYSHVTSGSGLGNKDLMLSHLWFLTASSCLYANKEKCT